MGFDFGQVNGKRFTSNSWVADENAWNINDSSVASKPLQSPLVTKPQSTWEKIKAFDFSPKKIVTQLGQGLAHGLSQTGTAQQDIGMANVLANSKLPAISELGRNQQQRQQANREYLEANPVNSIPATIGEQIPQIPLWMAGQLGVSAATKGITRLAPSLTGKVDKLPGIIKGGLTDAATYGGVVAPVDSIRKDENFGQFLDREKQLPGVFLGGAGVRGAGQIIGKGLKGARSVFSPRGVPQAPIQPTPLPTPLPRRAGPIQTPIQAPSIQQPLRGGPLNRFQVRADRRTPGTAIPSSISSQENGILSRGENMPRLNYKIKETIKTGTPDMIDPKLIKPVNSVDIERAKSLQKSIEESGWQGRPLLVIKQGSKYQAITGSHRIKAAKLSKIDSVPSHTIDNVDLKNAIKEQGDGYTVKEIVRDQDIMQRIIPYLKDARAKQIFSQEIKYQELNTPVPKIKPLLKRREVIQPVPTTPQRPNIGELKPVNERRFAQNVRDSQVAPGGVKQNTLDNPLTYEPITNKETLAKANLEVSSDAVKARAKFDAPSKGISADDVALGESLIVKAIKDGDTVGANVLIADLAEKLTTAGQAVQAAKMFKRLTPEGMLLYAQRVVNSTNKDLLSRLGKNAPKVELTPEDSTFIIETMRRIRTLPDGDEKRVAMAQIEKLIKDKVPATLAEKILAIQRISLLLNPRTMGRNVIGNTLFGAIDNVSNVVATPIDMLTSKLLKTNRTTTIPSFTGQLKSAKEGLKITARDAKMGIDTYHNNTQYEFTGKKIFTGKDPLNKTLDILDRATIGGLKLGDTPFHKAAYDDVLRQQMKLAGVTKATPAMEEQASQVALQRTYQDVNAWTEGFKLAQKALNGGKSLGLGNIVLPFVKTPANILARAMDYSPIGLQRAIRESMNISKGKFNQKAFVDSISRSVVGTAIIKVGYDLAKQGMITGGGNKDKDVAAFERGLGKNDFAWKMGDKYYTYEWAQPASMSLAVGADMYLKGKDKKDVENVIANAIKSGGETLFKQSVMQGLQRFMGGYDPIDNIARTGINAPTQLIPTLSNQLGQISDPTQRATYDPTNIGTGKNLLKARMPGLNKTLEPKINTFGETVQRNQGNNNLLNVFINPGTVTNFKPNDVQKEILRLYNATGEKGIFPRVAPKTLVYKGESIRLTPKEMTAFQQTAGKTTTARLKAIVDNSNSVVDDAARVEEFTKAIEKAYDDARIELLKSRGIQIK